MSEGGAESAGEENSDTKADFFEKGGEKKIHLQTFWQAVFASHSHFLFFFFFFWLCYPSPMHTKPVPEPSESTPSPHPLIPLLSGGPRAAITPVITITISPAVSAFPPSARKGATK